MVSLKIVEMKQTEFLWIHPSAARPSFPKRPAAFRPLLTKGLALSGFSFFLNFWIYFFGRPLKQNSSQMDIFN